MRSPPPYALLALPVIALLTLVLSTAAPALGPSIPGAEGPSSPAEAAAEIRLPALSPEEAARLAHQATSPGPLRLGFGRAIPAHAAATIGPDTDWRGTAGGARVAAVSLTSAGALGLRLAVQVERLPDAARLRLFGGPGATAVAEIAGRAVTASVQRNHASGAGGEAAKTYWSPLIAGDSLTLRVELPPGINPEEVRLTLPRVSHFLDWPFASTGEEPTASGSCNPDAACHPEWDAPSRSTALLIHTDEGGSSGVCTGILLGDDDPATEIPYLLTAQHCIGGQTRASSLEVYFFHRSSRCGGPLGEPQAVFGGADLLYAAQTTDTSFLRLRSAPPEGAVFAPWSAALPEAGTEVTGLHHPRGKGQRISFGTLTEHLSCEDVDNCADPEDADGVHYLRVIWRDGVTEPGGSGSGLFLPSGELVGTLFGGFSRCDNPGGPDDYGRFDIPYHAALHRWLGPSAASEPP